jgi:6-pyruvoyl-tetrahydropterin synthase
MAYPGFRETLHGHNYRLSVAVEGALGAQGYVIDFGIVKKIARRLCDRLDERTLIPLRSDCLEIREEGASVRVRYENDVFVFPASDVVLLPIVHTSVEELARYLAGELEKELAAADGSDVTAIEIGVEESFGQTAFFRQEANPA